MEQTLLDRLGLRLGQTFKVGDQAFVARAVLIAEPDRLTRGFALGPACSPAAGAGARRLAAPGRLLGPGGADRAAAGADPAAAIAAIRAALPGAALDARQRGDAANGIKRLIDQLEYFLGLVGLASLIAGGLGVAGAVSAYLEGRTPAIATLKAMGASSGLVRDAYLIQIAALAALGIAIGLVLGAGAPFLLGWIAGDRLPVPALFALYPAPLERAALFGALAAAAFSLGPLARARSTPPSALLRRQLGAPRGLTVELVFAVLAGAGLAALSIWTPRPAWSPPP